MSFDCCYGGGFLIAIFFRGACEARLPLRSSIQDFFKSKLWSYNFMAFRVVEEATKAISEESYLCYNS